MAGPESGLSLKELASVATIWLLAVAGPPLMAAGAARPGWLLLTALAIAYALLAYDAVNAWRRGRRLPLVLRVLVPVLLLLGSLAALHAGLWPVHPAAGA
jgi:hypothetical protein